MTAYTTREVSELLGLKPRQIRSYARSGLVDPDRGRGNRYLFSFKDMVLLRTARGLAEAQVTPRRIRRALRALKEQLPRGRALSEVRITAEGDEVVVRDAGTAWAPTSEQLVLDFEVAELADRVKPMARRSSARAAGARQLDADEWYDLAVDLEAYAPGEAIEAYDRALEIEPRHADAHCNLGRLLHETGRVREAAAHYRQALASRADHATAAFNLGIALEDQKQLLGAIRAYRQALAADPHLADAHFNLARLYEQLDDQTAALRHLKAYRKLIAGVS